jgi:Ca-activated chloride channel family protein
VSFEWPIALLALAALPLLVVVYLWYERRRVASQARFGNPDLLPNVIDREPGRLRYLPLGVLLVGLGMMIFGVARPHAIVTVPREEATVVLAIDVSRSMKAKDVQPTRLDAARGAAKAFLADVPEEYRVGVVSFATRAAAGVPPTSDRALVNAALDSLQPGEGTAIGDAVALAAELGERDKEIADAVPRSILLISDGTQDGGLVQPAAAIQEARKRNVPVYTVLVGTPEGVVEEQLPGGFRRVIQVPPSPQTLEQIAAGTGGEYFAAVDAEQLRAVYEQLGSRLGRMEEQREITDVFSGAAAAFLLVGGVLSAFLFRRVA